MNQNQNKPPAKLDELQAIFLRNVEHELRTPLTIIEGYASLLKEGQFGPLAPEQEEAMLVIVENASELHLLVERISALMFIQSGKLNLYKISPQYSITEILTKWHVKATQTNITFNVDVKTNSPEIMASPYHLQQAIDCILENAFKFTPEGGQVEFETKFSNNNLDIIIKDSGIGISPEALKHVFEPFYQADSSLSRHYEGLGLSLTLAKAIIEAHQGQIYVESTLGKGSQFILRIPCPPTTPLPKFVLTAPKRILIVDDEEFVTIILRGALKKLPNCEIITTTSATEAMTLFDEKPFDLLFTDYMMPTMNGLNLAKHIKILYPETKTVMITAFNNKNLHQEAADIAINHILDKPIELKEIRRLATEILLQQQQQRL